jgi:hypothetical protein
LVGRVGTLEQKRANPQWWLPGKPNDSTVQTFVSRFQADALFDQSGAPPYRKIDGKWKLQPVQVELDALPPDVLRQAFPDEISRW